MNRYLCIHGHFYQPPRENPWLEEVELQDSAYPFHDWNQKITSECYAPNTAARILDGEEKIARIINNYTNISFNFGPTLFSWLNRNDPVIHEEIIKADEESQKKFSGHGSALAQCYNHMIMPLASRRDKETQIKWGLADFEHRFHRKAEGMWLPETAVDYETLDILAAEGIKFTILAPNQAKVIRKMGEEKWIDVSNSRIDPKRPYLCRLPSGAHITIFFYDGPISRDIAFGDLLKNGEDFARRLVSTFSQEPTEDEIVHISTDGETYGHHHHMGDMALAYCTQYVTENGLAQLTNYGEFLEAHSPQYEVEIFENSSWSCCHGIERWRKNCGCNSGTHRGWNQKWRKPLREALDWLRDNLFLIYEEQASLLLKDVWLARNEYIQVILDRSQNNVEKFLSEHSAHKLDQEQKIKALKLLELQRNAMLMFTSCGWFFDEISGMETVQILKYAAKAIQLSHDLTEMKLEKMFLHQLKKASSNITEYHDGAYIYEKLAKSAVLDLVRVGGHYAVSSLFEDYADKTDIYSYSATNQIYDRLEMGKQKVAVGEVKIRSEITWEEEIVSFAVLHLGGHNLVGGVRQFVDEKEFSKMHKEIKDAFRKQNVEKTRMLIEKHFDVGQYSLQHLFKDEQSKVLYQILDSTLEDVEVSLRQINEHHYPIIQVIKRLHIPLPKVLVNTVLVMVNTDLLRVLGGEKIDFIRLEELVSEVKEWSLEVDKVTIEFVVRRRVTGLMEEFEKNPKNVQPLKLVEPILRILHPLHLSYDLWKSQNIYFFVAEKMYQQMLEQKEKGNAKAKEWIHYFDRVGNYFKVNIS